MATKEPTLKDIYLLAKNPSLASKFDEVYGPGAANQVLSSQSRTNLMTETRLSQPPPGASSASNYAGAIARGLVGPAVGTAMGAAGPVGMLAGQLALPASDALTNLMNLALAGTEKLTDARMPRMMPASQGLQNLLTAMGVPQAETPMQRAVQSGAGALGGVTASLPGLTRMATTAVTPMGRAVSAQAAQQPAGQLAVAAPAGAAGQLTSELSKPYLGDLGSTVAGMGSGVVVGGLGMPKQQRPPAQMSQADIRAAAVAQKAKDLGFTEELSLTPGQAGTNKTAQLFEAAASTLPGSAGQFRNKYAKQSDYAENLVNQIANMFGGMPKEPDVAFSSSAQAIKNATYRNKESIGSSIRNVASQSDIDLMQTPDFRKQILAARQKLQSLPPSMRKEPLFQQFEEFYFGKQNDDLLAKISEAMKGTGMSPTNANYKKTEAQVRQALLDSGVPEFEHLGYQQKGLLPGADYQDQRVAFDKLAFENRGTKIGEAFKDLKDALDNARDQSFLKDGLIDQVSELKRLRSSYGQAKELNEKLQIAGDKTAVNYISNNQDNIANLVIPLMTADEKLALTQGILADIKLKSQNNAGDLDITKFGKTVIQANERTPSTFGNILGQESATNLVNLADVAQSALKSKVPTSGSAERLNMINLLTSTPAKIGAAMASGTALTGEPILGTALALGTPALASKIYLSPTVQNLYDRLRIKDPLLNYMANPIDPMRQYLQTPGLLYSNYGD
jgi:hypothetical protein